MDKILLFNLPITQCKTTESFLDHLNQALRNRQSLLVSFVNPHAWHVAQELPAYRNDLDHLDVILADGIGVVRVLKWIEGRDIVRLSFDDTSLYRPVLGELEQHEASLFIAGASPGIADQAAIRMKQDFSNLKIVGTHHGHDDPKSVIEQIIKSNPDAVLCGMGIPRQEKFILALKQAGFHGVALTCGGFLDQLVAGERYYPPLIDRLELRWLYRLCKEPRRLGRRYLIEYWPFLKACAGCMTKLVLQGAVLKVFKRSGKQPGGASERL